MNMDRFQPETKPRDMEREQEIADERADKWHADQPIVHPSPFVISQLLSLFVLHGAVPGFEFTAEGFDIKQLERDGLIVRGKGQHDAGRYVMGPALEKARVA